MIIVYIHFMYYKKYLKLKKMIHYYGKINILWKIYNISLKVKVKKNQINKINLEIIILRSKINKVLKNN